MSDAVNLQFVCHDSSGFIAMASQQPLEEALCSGTIPAALKKHVHDVTVLIDRAPPSTLFRNGATNLD